MNKAQKHIERARTLLERDELGFGMESLDGARIFIKSNAYDGIVHKVHVEAKGPDMIKLKHACDWVDENGKRKTVSMAMMSVYQDHCYIDDFNYTSELNLREEYTNKGRTRSRTYSKMRMDPVFLLRALLVIAFRHFPTTKYVKLQDLSGPIVDKPNGDGTYHWANLHAMLGEDERTFYVKEGFKRNGEVKIYKDHMLRCMSNVARTEDDIPIKDGVNFKRKCTGTDITPTSCFHGMKGDKPWNNRVQNRLYQCAQRSSYIPQNMTITRDVFESLNKAKSGLVYRRTDDINGDVTVSIRNPNSSNTDGKVRPHENRKREKFEEVRDSRKIEMDMYKSERRQKQDAIVQALHDTMKSIRQGNPQTKYLDHAADESESLAGDDYEFYRELSAIATDLVTEMIRNPKPISHIILKQLMWIITDVAAGILTKAGHNFILKVARIPGSSEIIDKFLDEYDNTGRNVEGNEVQDLKQKIELERSAGARTKHGTRTGQRKTIWTVD